MQRLSRRAVRSFTTGTLVLLILSAISSAQIDTASIVGTIKDPSGAVVAKARITVKNVATNETQTATAAEDGLYSFPYLRIGTYSVTVEAAGFKDLDRHAKMQESLIYVGIDIGPTGVAHGSDTMLSRIRSRNLALARDLR